MGINDLHIALQTIVVVQEIFTNSQLATRIHVRTIAASSQHEHLPSVPSSQRQRQRQLFPSCPNHSQLSEPAPAVPQPSAYDGGSPLPFQHPVHGLCVSTNPNRLETNPLHAIPIANRSAVTLGRVCCFQLE